MTQNPFCNPEHPPQVEELTTLAGGRTAILFEDFRAHVARTSGVMEEFRYLGPEQGWVLSYQAGDRGLCLVQVLPGSLTASFELDRPTWERVLSFSRVAPIVKRTLSEVIEDSQNAKVRVELRSKSLTRAWAGLLYWLSTDEPSR